MQRHITDLHIGGLIQYIGPELTSIAPAVYILASTKNGTLYVGVTSDLVQRIWQHRNETTPGFTSKYDVKKLVWFEQHPTMQSAFAREKTIKRWNRTWKLELIEAANPTWTDLWQTISQVGVAYSRLPPA